MGKLPFPGFPPGMGQQLPYRNADADNGHDLTKPSPRPAPPPPVIDPKIEPSLKSPTPVPENQGKRKFVSDRGNYENINIFLFLKTNSQGQKYPF